LVITLALLVLLSHSGQIACAAGKNIRTPAVAGRFYPENPDKLRAAINRFMTYAIPAKNEQPIAIVSPHAGYIYSGQIMADAFAQARPYDYDLIVLLGVNHTTPGFDGVSVFSTGGFKTPLGIAKIDSEAAQHLIRRYPQAVFDKSVHREEHSIEVLVPFVQILFPDKPILPIIVSHKDDDSNKIFGKVLAQSLIDRNALIVASSDLSHYPTYARARQVDQKTLQAMISLDIDRYQRVIRNQISSDADGLSTCACGDRPTMAAMTASKYLGASRGYIVSYANSGDALVGKRDRVVGYGAVGYSRQSAGKKDFPNFQTSPHNVLSPLTSSQQRRLLQFARIALSQFFESETLPLPRFTDSRLHIGQGAFVTLKRHGQLRGCIGHMADNLPLCHTVGRMALQAAFSDHRFSPLKASELEEIEIEISALTPFQQVDGPTNIVVGQDGVMIRKSGRSAVFLPQVAPEQGWNREEMLTHLCQKAGLSDSAWKEGATFYTFQAQVFNEGAFKP
jgi:AmmeMemoRadiSam system protein B/AmmeMemoRadiSam system protein A